MAAYAATLWPRARRPDPERVRRAALVGARMIRGGVRFDEAAVEATRHAEPHEHTAVRVAVEALVSGADA